MRAPKIYLAYTDEYGMTCIEQFNADWHGGNVAEIANDYPDTIYFEVMPPRNHVTFHASQDVSGDGVTLSTWSVYREEYAPSDLDNPLDNLTVMVATVATEALADSLADHLFDLQVNDR